MTNEEVIEILEKEESYMLSHYGDRQAKALRIAIDKIKQEPFINKPCVSSEVCEHDKQKVLDKIRAEIEEQVLESLSDGGDDWFTAEKVNECLDIIDRYTAESKVKE